MIRVDNSMLQDIFSCSTRAWVKYVQGKQMRSQESKVSERMQVGSLFHTVFEHCLMQWQEEANLTWFGNEYMRVFPEGVTQEKFELGNLTTIARVWLQHNSGYFRDYAVLSVEETLEMELQEGVVFFGTPDAVVENAHGLWVVESKTTGWLREESKRFWARGSQGMGYWELVRAKYGREPRGVVWNVVEIGKIPPYDGNLSKKCQKHGVKYLECQPLHVNQEMIGPVVYTREQLREWRRFVSQGAYAYKNLLALERGAPEMKWLMMEGRFSYPGCSTCSFTDWCWAGRPVGLMEQMMEDYCWPVQQQEEG